MKADRGGHQVAPWTALVAGLMVIVGAGSGCGGSSPGSSLAPSEARARELLTTCLDAWKGGKASGLSSEQPPIRFDDPDLALKSSLVGYSIGDPTRSFGHVIELSARLELKDRRGRTRSVEADYQITTEPGPAVLRVEPGH